jgi:hypothetical protein
VNRQVLTKVFFPGLSLIFLLAACGTTLLKKDAPRMEQALIEAGFQMVPADTPEKVAKLQALPLYKLVKRKSNGQDVYIYADPTNCQCAYIGDAQQYATFKRYIGSMSITESDALNARMETEEQMEAATDAWDPL